MKFRFKIQEYQTRAVDNTVRVFAGQPSRSSEYRRDVDARDLSSTNLPSIGYANAALELNGEQLLSNIQQIQKQAGLEPSYKLESKSPGACGLDIEMETGTGKTYVYIKTIHELHRTYGWSKFIIVVPSIAIREGVSKNFAMLEDHFMEQYGTKARYFIYDSSPSGLKKLDAFASSNDIYVSASQIRRFGLRNGDVVWGIIRPPKDQEHYEALLRVENVNFTDPEEARRRPHFEALTPIFPNEKLQLETDRRQIATRIVDIFAPIGKGQRALIVSPPKAGKTTLLKSLAHSITTNHPEVILMVLLIDERPEEVTDMARSVDGEIIASTFDRPAEEHLRVAGLALEKAKRLVEVSKDRRNICASRRSRSKRRNASSKSRKT